MESSAMEQTKVDSETVCPDNRMDTQQEEPEDVTAEVSRKRLKTMEGSPTLGDEAGSESPVIPEKLEVPSKELQCIQKQVLIEKLMGTTSKGEDGEETMEVANTDGKGKEKPRGKTRRNKPAFRTPAPPLSMKPSDFRETFKLKSSILDRVKTFLPEMKNANEELLRLPDPSKLSLESDSDRDDVDGGGGAVAGPSTSDTGDQADKTYVEMNLALVEHSDDSDSSSDDEQTQQEVGTGKVKGLPEEPKVNSSESSTLITELN